MHKLKLAILLSLAIALLIPVIASADASINKDGDSYKIAAAGYEAIVASDGCLTNIKINGTEFLKPNIGISRGTYFYINGAIKLPNIKQLGNNTLIASSDQAQISYEFKDNAMLWIAKNITNQIVPFFLVVDTGIKAVSIDGGNYQPIPTNANAASTSWIVGGKKLTISGSNRLWGPWEGGTQVCEVTLQPGESRTIGLSISVINDNEKNILANLMQGKPLDYNGFELISPVECRVFQRQSRYSGSVQISGKCDLDCDTIEYRITGISLKGALSGAWNKLPFNTMSRRFNQTIQVPAGGWYRFQIRALKSGKSIFSKNIEKMGVGEVFIAAGQSNSTNCGQFPTKQTSGMVSCFSGTKWEIKDDPFTGTHDNSGGGSCYPAFGDAMYKKYRVPIAVASTGHGGTSVSQWNTDGELFNWMMTRIYQLGPGGFRAVMWHQGESDVQMPTETWYAGMSKLINDSNRQAGWSFPWMIAGVSYHNPQNPSWPLVRAAQKKLWDDRVALEGPDSDTLTGDNRDYNGSGIHFSPKGLKSLGEMWAQKISIYLDTVL